MSIHGCCCCLEATKVLSSTSNILDINTQMPISRLQVSHQPQLRFMVDTVRWWLSSELNASSLYKMSTSIHFCFGTFHLILLWNLIIQVSHSFHVTRCVRMLLLYQQKGCAVSCTVSSNSLYFYSWNVLWGPQRLGWGGLQTWLTPWWSVVISVISVNDVVQC